MSNDAAKRLRDIVRLPLPDLLPLLDEALAAERAMGWQVTETAEDDGSWSVVSNTMPGLVVSGQDRADAWRQWPEVVELWASSANDMRVKSERSLAAERRLDVELLAEALRRLPWTFSTSITLHSDRVAAEYARLRVEADR